MPISYSTLKRLIYLTPAASLLLGTGCSPSKSGTSSGAITPGTSVSTSTASTNPPGDGPFGLPTHARLADLPIDRTGPQPQDNLYRLTSVPSPNSSFVSYFVKAFDGVGICEVRAVSADFDGDSLGTKVRSSVDELAEALATKYGKPVHEDECASTCEGEYWSMSMGEGNRSYGYSWQPKGGAGTPRAVKLWVGVSTITPYMRLDYDLNDRDACANAAKRATVKSL